MDGQALPGAVRGWQKWHSFQLVHIHGAQTTGTGKRIVSPEYASGKIHLETDMHRCLWWTFAAAAMNDLDKWLFPEHGRARERRLAMRTDGSFPGSRAFSRPSVRIRGQAGEEQESSADCQNAETVVPASSRPWFL